MTQLPLDIDPKHTATCFVDGCPWMFRPDFKEWLLENWHIWEGFKREADRIWRTGREHYAGRTIVEYLRHETALAQKSGEFKINDHYTPNLCRLWECYYPTRIGFFEKRERKAA